MGRLQKKGDRRRSGGADRTVKEAKPLVVGWRETRNGHTTSINPGKGWSAGERGVTLDIKQTTLNLGLITETNLV